MNGDAGLKYPLNINLSLHKCRFDVKRGSSIRNGSTQRKMETIKL